MSTDDPKPHSADYFGPQRDFWWNADFLDLMAWRWHLADVRRVLDVGCGAGHWARQILPRCHPEATLLGVDREPTWIDLARRHAHGLDWGTRATFQIGDATDLGALGHVGGFDLVTCQTVLIHLADPARALAGMVSQLRPGGRVVVAEPNNLVGNLVSSTVDRAESMDDRLARLRFHWICETGKKNLGEGDNSLGDRVPELFAQAGLTDLQVYTSDKVSLLTPPYASPEQQAVRDEAYDHAARDFAGWDRETASRYFVAGGGAPDAFESGWARERKRVMSTATALREGRYYANETGVFYLVSGVVPAN